MKTPQEVAREALGADALAGIGYGKYLPYMERAIKADRAQRHPVSIDPDEAQGLADRFREAAEGDSGDAEISAAADMAEYLESLAAEARKATMSMAPADLATLASAAAHWATELTDYIIDGSLTAGDLDSAELQTQERDEIQAALARYLGSEKDI